MNPELARNIEGVFGDRGRDWLAALPGLVDDCERRWNLTVGPPFVLSFNYVVPAVLGDGTAVVLKVGVPDRGLLDEIAALAAYDGCGCARLLEADPEQGIMLLERLSPGTLLSEIGEDDVATRIAAGVMRKLHCPAPADHSFATVLEWARGMDRLRVHFGGGTGPFPPRLVEEAERLFVDLLASQGPPVLLHGDLHHFNILRDGDRWLAIDPKGVVGEAEYEIGALLRNPDQDVLARRDSVRMQKRRIEILADELGFDRARLRDWAVAQAVLSVWWTIEDRCEGVEVGIACAERLAEVRF